MNDLLYLLHIGINEYRSMPLSYYIDLMKSEMRMQMPEEQLSKMLDKLQSSIDADAPVTPAEQKHQFCCRVFKMKCECPWTDPVYPRFSAIVKSTEQEFSVSIRCKLDYSDTVTLYKPLQSGLYEWTQRNFTWDTMVIGLASGTMTNGHFRLQHY